MRVLGQRNSTTSTCATHTGPYTNCETKGREGALPSHTCSGVCVCGGGGARI